MVSHWCGVKVLCMVFICGISIEILIFFFNRNCTKTFQVPLNSARISFLSSLSFLCRLFSQQYSELFLMPSISSVLLGRGQLSAKQQVNRLLAFSVVTGTYVFSEEFICQKKTSLRIQVKFW